MDLALGFAPSARRNSKMVLPLHSFRSKSFDDSMSIHIPMGSDPPSIFSSPGSCRLTRFAMGPQYDSTNCNFMPKSAQFGRSSPGFQKIMMPKEPSLAISSRQTIVGGFVGSKTYAGRSMFGDSSQIWDALVCKFVELMSMVKEKPASLEPRNKMPSTPTENCVLGNEGHAWKYTASNDSVGSPKCATCPSSNECVPRNIRVSKLTETSNIVPSDNIPFVYKAVVPECSEEFPHNPSTESFPHHKGTYSSVVDGSFKNECAISGACTMVKLKEKDQPPEGSRAGVQRVPLQSYADVAKIIPNKPMRPLNKTGYEVPQNSRNMWVCKAKRNKSSLNRKGMNHQGSKSRTIAMNEILTCGDTRWKGDWKSKRENFQRKCPEAATPNIYSSSSTETSEDSCAKSSSFKDSETDSDLECKRLADESEPTRPGCLKDGFRGRHPSECSLDSEDSFVIFEDCPDSALGTSPCISIDRNPLEECGSEDEESCSSSGSSDDEDNDDDFDSGEHLVKFDCPSSNSKVKEDCIWMRKFSAQTVPEISKGVKKKTVHFAEGSNLVVVRPMVAWDFAYRESRRGPWEVHARDRARFQCRIASLAPILNAIFDPLHRQKVESRLHDL